MHISKSKTGRSQDERCSYWEDRISSEQKKQNKKKNKWTDERNDAHIGESRLVLGIRSFGPAAAALE